MNLTSKCREGRVYRDLRQRSSVTFGHIRQKGAIFREIYDTLGAETFDIKFGEHVLNFMGWPLGQARTMLGA